MFERGASYANGLKLLAEEVDPMRGALLGICPQGFKHLGLICCALHIAEVGALGPGERAENQAGRAGRMGKPERCRRSSVPNRARISKGYKMITCLATSPEASRSKAELISEGCSVLPISLSIGNFPL